MKVLIISTNRNDLPVPVLPAGACIVAEAAERAGHRVTFLDLMFESEPLRMVEQAIVKTRPDIIGLSVRNIDNNDMQSPAFFAGELPGLVDLIREKSTAVLILGGAAVSVMPEELLRFSGISCAVTGDGENVFPELLERISRGETITDQPGTSWIEDGTVRHNPVLNNRQHCHSIVPDYNQWISMKDYLSRLSTIPVQTKLGCHFKCIYCTYRKIEGSIYRYLERDSVMDSINRLASAGLRDIEFTDNVFNYPYDHAFDMCERLARADMNLRLQSLELNPLFIDDRLVDVMERSGFRGIGITVESASDVVLSRLRKGYTAADVHRASEVIRSHRLPCLWIFMIGGPGESNRTVSETLKFAECCVRPSDTVFFNVGVRIYPGTELEAIAREEGLLHLSAQEMLPPVFYISPELDTQWMVKKIRNAMSSHMNFINSDSIGLSYLPTIHRIGYKFGLKNPLWRYTRFIRRGLRIMGVNA
jgi:radical SAM superfamily enzyme YgiQ (UPF0313 family)